jgi:hypothetical protein
MELRLFFLSDAIDKPTNNDFQEVAFQTKIAR